MRIQSDLETDPELQQLLDRAREYEMSDEEMEEQRISFAYGNLALHDPSITKDDIRRAAKRLRLESEEGKANAKTTK